MSDSNHQTTGRNQRALVLDTNIRGGLATIAKEGTCKQLLDFYNDNASEYNEMSDLMQFETGCRAIAEEVAKLHPNRNVRILDCAAGTGYAGKELHKLGYNNVDALDPSEQMLQLARSLNIYKNYIIDSVKPDQKNSVMDATYDAIFISGAVLQGHITLDCLSEVTRMLKKDGTLTFNIADKYLKTDPQLKDDVMKRRFQSHVDNGDWLKWEAKRAQYRKSEMCNIYTIYL